ncbi:FAD binding domain-containing protein [Mariniplasma anaerobium]|uniref:Xanthine dehydrogenase FAD-binding subunit XdhB n=1 Tax=Mariniplasma anaerobium TaxID=2735436 RepID=A0A7U9TII5_9MOLU|nr:FAD binding domain-containing protein [Mariniplasma anaerobium]BCR36739.1 xanthine dehydrogenase FAD-binding subunit XdhB [Mariniplasma anaerobium]
MEINLYHKAKSLKEAYEILNQNPKNSILGGGTWLKQSSSTLDTLIDLCELGLDQIIETKEAIEIGALVTLYEIESNLAIKALGKGFISESLSNILGVGFRNIATIGGTIAGRYAFSDFITSLLTLDVKLLFFPKKEISLEDFLNTKGKMTDILTHIIIKKSPGKGFFKKVSGTTLEFAILDIAVYQENHTYKISLGSRPSVAMLSHEAAEFLNKQEKITEEVLEQTVEIVLDTVKLGSNKAATKEYREVLAKTYVKRGIKEVTSK